MQEPIAPLRSPRNQMVVVYRSVAGSSSNVAFSAVYWSTFQNEAQTVHATSAAARRLPPSRVRAPTFGGPMGLHNIDAYRGVPFP